MSVVLLVIATLLSLWAFGRYQWISRSRRLPPGPPRHLIFDNRGDMSFGVAKSWKSIHEWHRQFGPVVSFYLGRKLFISLGTLEGVTDLMEKRGAIYSSRPRAIMSSEILSQGLRGANMPYSQAWKNYRYLLQSGLSITACAEHKPLQTLESTLVLRDIVESQHDPKKFPNIIRRYASSVVTNVAYGRRVTDLNDEIIVAQNEMEMYFVKANTPGKYLVEMFPIFLWLPKPLQWFRHEFDARFHFEANFLMDLASSVKERMKRGTAYASVATRALDKQAAFGLSDLETAYALSAPLGAGAGTTIATITWFFLAMLNYPDVMRKAQLELDTVVGTDRLPNFEDAENLPYIDAIIKETMRWRPIAPLGFPHSVISDDIYNGYVVPKDTTIVGNIYAISQTEELFPDASGFNPDRYIVDPSLPHQFVFGAGRRICPGMHLARNSLFILVSRILWAFDIRQPEDPRTSKPLVPSPDDVVPGFLVVPQHFDYLLVPRGGGKTASIIAQAAVKAEGDLGGYD